MTTAKEMLHTEAAMWRELFRRQCPDQPDQGPVMFKQWLIDNGEEFGPAIRVRGLPLMRIKECFANSLKTVARYEVDRDEWFYTEGVVLTDGLPILIDHAWLSNEKGEVLDRTLRSQKDATYFGIPFKPQYAIDETMKHGYYGLFSNQVTYNRDVVGIPVGENRAWPKRGEFDHVKAA